MSVATYSHKFVKAFPDRMEEGVLYVSVDFGTAAHRCFCGCGSEVYTRFSPLDWSMRFNGDTVSITPSIGNWSFPCQSHYILDGGRVHWAAKWSRERIELGRLLDRERKEGRSGEVAVTSSVGSEERYNGNNGLVARVVRWFRGR